MNSVHASLFPKLRVLISAKCSETACLCTVMVLVRASGRGDYYGVAQVCTDLVERWDDLTLNFRTHRQTSLSAVRAQPSFEAHVFENRVSIPR